LQRRPAPKATDTPTPTIYGQVLRQARWGHCVYGFSFIDKNGASRWNESAIAVRLMQEHPPHCAGLVSINNIKQGANEIAPYLDYSK
jgi:hypothetical protein